MKLIRSYLDEVNWSKGVKIEKGKMYKVLGIPDDGKIIDNYKDGKKLAKDLVAKVGKKEAAGMLAYVANLDPKQNVLDIALKSMKEIE